MSSVQFWGASVQFQRARVQFRVQVFNAGEQVLVFIFECQVFNFGEQVLNFWLSSVHAIRKVPKLLRFAIGTHLAKLRLAARSQPSTHTFSRFLRLPLVRILELAKRLAAELPGLRGWLAAGLHWSAAGQKKRSDSELPQQCLSVQASRGCATPKLDQELPLTASDPP